MIDDFRIIKRYENRKGTVAELCDDLGIAKPTLYTVLRRNGVDPQTQRREGKSQLDRIEEKLDRLLGET